MGASITLAGETLIAQKHVAQQGLDVVRFIFANVPGLDPSVPVDRAAPKPVAGQIVHVYEIPDDNAGYVNPNQVVYSAQIGSDIGDWDFNWIGLETAEGTLFAVATVALQQKRRNIPPLQIGNNLTRNFLVAFDGAQALTGITVDASTWQHDFTVRLAGIDERERLSNRDIFGRACFFGASLQLEKVGSVYQLKPGSAYVEGIRVVRSAALAVVHPALPTTAWLDIALQRELSDVGANWQVVFGANKPDYTDSVGVRHYCVPLADLVDANTITDRRSVEPINGPLVAHFAARVGDYADLRARATTKVDVGLGTLPNAKSDNAEENNSEILATTKAVKTAFDRLVKLELLDAGAGNLTHQLPSAGAAQGVLEITLRRTDLTANALVIAAAGTDKIMLDTTAQATGQATTELLFSGDWLRLRSDGAGKWWCVGQAQLPASVSYGLITYPTAGSFTFAVPAVLRSGRKLARVITTAAGGAGGITNAGPARGGGGGAGGTAIKLINLTGVSSVPLVVGAGVSGGAGGTSSFGGYCSATGGLSGSDLDSGAGAEGGVGIGGDLNLKGGYGSDGTISIGGGSGDGGASYWGGGQRSSGGAGNAIYVGAPGGGGGGCATAPRPTGVGGIVNIEWS